MVLFDFERFLEQVRSDIGLPVLQVHPAPLHAVIGIFWILGNQGTELIIRVLVFAGLPQRLGLLEGLRRKYGSDYERDSAETEKPHLSNSSCVLASSSKRLVSCCLY